MGAIKIGQREYSVDCIIFDKDGTLIDFDAFWGPRTEKWVEEMAAALHLGEDFKNELYELIGYSISDKRVRFEGPLAVASMVAIYTLAAGVIARYGTAWHEARILAENFAKFTMVTEIKADEVVPKGNLAQAMQQLRQAQIAVAVVTSDDRQMTEKTLASLGIRDFVSVMICGDDPLPNKPAPDGIWMIAQQLNLTPDRMMMVGDSLSDMQFAANAGVAYRFGITSDPQAAAVLSAHTDGVISSVDEIIVRVKGSY